MQPTRRYPVALSLLLACACVRSGGGDVGTWQAERETHGDTTVVRTITGQVWQVPRRTVVDLSIGTLDGPAETMFGSVHAIAPDNAGGVYVYDSQVPVIRYFDSSGQFVRQVGRDGEGPGEYRDAVLGMAIRSDGRLQIRDARNGRVTIYEPDGSFSSQWIVASGLFTSWAMFLDQNDDTYLKILQEQPQQNQPWKIGLLHYDAAGKIVDTIPDPWVPNLPSGNAFIRPVKEWTFGFDGSMIVGVSDEYRFEIRRPDGTVTRVERPIERLAMTDAEHAAYEERRRYTIERQGQFMTTLPGETPRIKPVFRALNTDQSGRVWVHLYGPVEPKPDYEPAAEGDPPVWPFIEPKLYDVFQADGTYLGRVHVPHDVTVHYFGDAELWGVRTGNLGEHYVVRLRLEPT